MLCCPILFDKFGELRVPLRHVLGRLVEQELREAAGEVGEAAFFVGKQYFS